MADPLEQLRENQTDLLGLRFNGSDSFTRGSRETKRWSERTLFRARSGKSFPPVQMLLKLQASGPALPPLALLEPSAPWVASKGAQRHHTCSTKGPSSVTSHTAPFFRLSGQRTDSFLRCVQGWMSPKDISGSPMLKSSCWVGWRGLRKRAGSRWWQRSPLLGNRCSGALEQGFQTADMFPREPPHHQLHLRITEHPYTKLHVDK